MKKFVALILSAALLIAAAAAAIAAEPKKDLVVCMAEDLETFDTTATSALNTQAIFRTIHIRLYYEDEDGAPMPWLVKEFNVIDPNKEVQIVIHDNFKYTDGTAVTAEDVAASLMRCKASPMFGVMMRLIDSFEAIDATTLKINLSGPAPALQTVLSHGNTGIMPKSYLERAAATGDWSEPITGGPYMLAERSVGRFTKVVKNPHHTFQETQARSESITFLFVPDASSRQIMVETGEADVNFAFATQGLKTAEANPDLKVHSRSSNVTQYICLDNTLKPFDDKRVRQAISYALNRDDIITMVLEGRGEPSYAPLSPLTMGYLDNPAKISYDPEKAKALLAEAGYPNGFDTKLMAFNDIGKRVAEAAQGYLADIGINAEIETYEASVRANMVKAHQVPMMVGSWSAFTDAELVLPRLFGEAAFGTTNMSYFSDPRTEELFVKARSTYDAEARTKFYEQADAILAEECPWACIYHPTTFTLTRADLKGVRQSGSGILNFWRLYY